jgi:hypothetical protein
MDGGFWAAIITWGAIGAVLVVTGMIMEMRVDSGNKQ